MFLAATAFVAAALVQMQIDVSRAQAHVIQATQSHWQTSTCLPLENAAHVPIKQRGPSQVPQHGRPEAGHQSWNQQFYVGLSEGKQHDEPAWAGPLQRACVWRPCWSSVAFSFQANDNYMTFDDQFELTIGKRDPQIMALIKGNRTTIVILEDLQLRTQPVSMTDASSN